ncbi:MAG TPA: choice-of-anchor D domain-containing protein [Dokdonella sp.]
MKILVRVAFAVLSVVALPASAQVLANINPAAVDFGAVKMGATVSVPVTIHNVTGMPVSIASGGLTAPGFALDAATCATQHYQIDPSASCDFVVSFTPTDNTGSVFPASLALLVSAGSLTQTAIVRLSGSGTDHLAQVSPVGIDFGPTFIGQQVGVPVTLTNTHSAPITFVGGGVAAGPFSADSGTCPQSLAAGASCHFDYWFTASDTTAVQASTTIGTVTSSPSSMADYVAIELKGEGSATLPTPNVAAWPAAIDFGSIGVGQDVSVLVNYKNNGSVPLSQAGGGFNDDQGGVFSAVSTDIGGCTGSTIPSGAQCAIRYGFLPHEDRAYATSTSIVFFDGAGDDLVAPVSVSGTGIGTLARVSPRSIDFGPVVFATYESVPVVVTNTSTSALMNFAGGSVTPPFSMSNDCGSSLAVGASCTLTYTFYAPSAQATLEARYTATTLLTFTNQTGIQPIVPITLSASVGDRVFGDGFER